MQGSLANHLGAVLGIRVGDVYAQAVGRVCVGWKSTDVVGFCHQRHPIDVCRTIRQVEIMAIGLGWQIGSSTDSIGS